MPDHDCRTSLARRSEGHQLLLEPCLSMLSELSTAVGVLSECCRSAVDGTAGTAVQCCRTAVGLLSDCCRGCCRSVVDCCRPCQSEDMLVWCRSLSICRCCRLSELSTAVDRCRPLSTAVDRCRCCRCCRLSVLSMAVHPAVQPKELPGACLSQGGHFSSCIVAIHVCANESTFGTSTCIEGLHSKP